MCEYPDCGRPSKARGLCVSHWHQWRRGVELRPIRAWGRPAEERFREKVEFGEPHECWRWIGSSSNGGYGALRVGRTSVPAHRFSYELHVGPIPDGLHIDHLCRNPSCVNPAHLEPVTPQENALRGIGPSAVNARKSECPQGHPLSGDNLYIVPSTGSRMCRTCIRARNRKESVQ